ncbi:MAG TPA: isoprenylcysteine carboxylmethyltransferase family protein [Pyrinomonadaceae bacterium]|nr:isoprenylcysteine carboxylmethyltransferase family protein [Pyrinomonadaceae bacterium]
MTIDLEILPTLVFGVVMLSWMTFAVVFFARKKPPAAPASKRERASIAGIVLQGFAYGIVWSVHRHFFSPIFVLSKPFEIALSVFTMMLAVASVWFTSAAVRTLGEQWSLGARLIEGHKLITEGPYQVVRNPIYTGMLGMLLVTGLAISHWIGLLIAIVIFAIGTVIRVRSEEKLLREAFGAEFEEYARTVPAVVPFLF